MKKNIAVLFIVFFMIPALAQEGGVEDVELITALSDKPVASVGDAVSVFTMLYGERGSDFSSGKALLQSKGLLDASDLTSEAPLKRGFLALMSARYLGLKDSLLYRITGLGRYDVRACIAAGIMEYTGGELDVLSGGELVEVIRKVADKSGGAQ